MDAGTWETDWEDRLKKRKVSQVEGAFTRCHCWKSILGIEDRKGMTDALIDLMGA